MRKRGESGRRGVGRKGKGGRKGRSPLQCNRSGGGRHSNPTSSQLPIRCPSSPPLNTTPRPPPIPPPSPTPWLLWLPSPIPLHPFHTPLCLSFRPPISTLPRPPPSSHVEHEHLVHMRKKIASQQPLHRLKQGDVELCGTSSSALLVIPFPSPILNASHPLPLTSPSPPLHSPPFSPLNSEPSPTPTPSPLPRPPPFRLPYLRNVCYGEGEHILHYRDPHNRMQKLL